MNILDDESKAAVQRTIDDNIQYLSRARGFVAAEPGFAVVEGKLVREPAILAYVWRWLPPESLLPEERLPEELGRYRVDVVEPDPWKALELADADIGISAALDAAATSALRYEGIENDPIDWELIVDGPFLCHVGPDTGWIPLKEFLEKVDERLTVAMYDFSADYIATSLIEAAESADASVALTIDNDLRERLGDGEESIQQRLKTRLGGRYDPAIIFCNGNGRFPSAYHPKVAVRDGSAIWLSSGNWSPPSQPPIDPIGDPASARTMFRRGNREWHIIAEDEGLAALFERYIIHDKEAAEEDHAGGAGTSLGMPDLLVPIEDLLDQAALDLADVQPVAPETLPSEPRRVRVQALLSPDNYARRIAEWIEGAEESLYLQYSYIKWSDAPHDAGMKTVLKHLAERSQDEDFDLRIIIGDNSARENAHKLAQNGFNEACLRVQSKIHNKGIVRDGTSVLISSHNWSGDGFLRNRDAGLIIHDEEVAAYYQRIFLADWDQRTRDPFEAAPASVQIVEDPSAPTPPGMVRISWADYFGE